MLNNLTQTRPISLSDVHDIAVQRSNLVDIFSDETVDPVYQAKAHALNQAIQRIGMGKYQVSCRINYAFFFFDRFGICFLVVSLCGRRLWLGCVRFSSSARVLQSHSEHLSSCVSPNHR